MREDKTIYVDQKKRRVQRNFVEVKEEWQRRLRDANGKVEIDVQEV